MFEEMCKIYKYGFYKFVKNKNRTIKKGENDGEYKLFRAIY